METAPTARAFGRRSAVEPTCASMSGITVSSVWPSYGLPGSAFTWVRIVSRRAIWTPIRAGVSALTSIKSSFRSKYELIKGSKSNQYSQPTAIDLQSLHRSTAVQYSIGEERLATSRLIRSEPIVIGRLPHGPEAA